MESVGQFLGECARGLADSTSWRGIPMRLENRERVGFSDGSVAVFLVRLSKKQQRSIGFESSLTRSSARIRK